MLTREVLEGMTAGQVMQQLQEVQERRRVAIARANDSITSYERTVSARDRKIRELKDELSRQLTDIADRVEALKPVMLKASMTGDGAELDRTQRILDELEGQRSQLNTRMKLLNGKPPRCDEAYAAMEAAVAESNTADTQYYDDICIIREFCKQTVSPWKDILSALENQGVSVSRFFLERAREHYSKDR